MRRSYGLIVLLLICAALRSCVAVKFETLEELLRYHEQQQNPDSNQEEIETEEDGFISMEITTTTRQPSSVNPHRHRDHHHFSRVEDGSGQEIFETTALTTTTAPMTMSVQETEEPMTTRRMTTCCLLGEAAGRKRHHCNPDNYMPTLFRHRNRGHNFKQTNKHPSQSKNQLDKCVSGIVRRLAEEFRTCCEEAYKRMWQSERGEEDRHGERTHILEIPIEG